MIYYNDKREIIKPRYTAESFLAAVVINSITAGVRPPIVAAIELFTESTSMAWTDEDATAWPRFCFVSARALI